MAPHERERRALRRINDTLLAYGFDALREGAFYADIFESVADCLEELDARVQSAPDPVLQRHAAEDDHGPQDCFNDLDAKDMADAREELWEGLSYWEPRK